MKRLRVNKQNRGQPELRTKTGYRGDVTATETISKKKNVLITGAHHSGKTKAIMKLYEEAEIIWTNQLRPYKFSNAKVNQDKPMLKQGESLNDWVFPEPVMLNGIAPLSKWTEHQGVKAWYESKYPDDEYKKVPAWRRVELIPEYLRDTRAILFVDDAHKLTGRKLQVAKLCLQDAFKIVVATSDENKLSPSVRSLFLETNPQIIRLNTDVAYDATHIVIWAIVAFLMVTGMTELAAMLGLFEALKGGRRGSKQD